MKRLLIAAALISSTLAGLLTGSAGPSVRPVVEAAAGCADPVPLARDAATLASGRGIWAVADGRLVSVGDRIAVARDALAARVRPAAAGSLMRGTIRHIATRRGVGTAFVLDRAGPDAVVAVTPRGVEVLPQAGDALQPAWSRGGRLAWSTASAIVVRQPVSGRIVRLPAPARNASVFSPVFLSEHRIAAIVSIPTAGHVFEGERLGNLWSTDTSGGRWRPITRFRARGDRWVTIRTPVARAGGIDFVRISAHAPATAGPAFELWRYEDGSTRPLERLEGERYLAGRLDGRLVWNRPDPIHSRDLLQAEDGGRMHTIGCGAVLVDPIDVPDPDRRPGSRLTPVRGKEHAVVDPAAIGAEEIAVIVGDFADQTQAAAAAASIRSAYPLSAVEVVDHADAPTAIRPGAFGALLHVASGADPTASLARFRNALPTFAVNSWIVTP